MVLVTVDTTTLQVSLHHVPGVVVLLILLQTVQHPLPQHHLLPRVLVEGEHGDGADHFTDDADDHDGEEGHHQVVVRLQ